MRTEITEIKKGSGNFPSHFDYFSDNNGDSLIVKLKNSKGNIEKHQIRGHDPWALAAFRYLNKDKGKNFKEIILEVIDLDRNNIELEALIRRISFLKINNRDLNITLLVNSAPIALIKIENLLSKQINEVLHAVKDYKKRYKPSSSQGLEKLVQEFLFGSALETGDNKIERTNERLAIFGTDFYSLKGKGYKMTREFPTGVFNNKVSKLTRNLPTEFVDFISINKWQELAVIELKVDDCPLEVFSQALNYVLFFATYKEDLLPILENTFGIIPKKDIIKCYIVANKLHPKFELIKSFYKVNDKKKIPFEIVPTILGHYVEM